MVSLKYLSNFWRTLKIPEISLQFKWSGKCFLVAGTVAFQVPKFAITDIKLFIPVVTLSTHGN